MPGALTGGMGAPENARDAPGMGFDLHKLNKFAKGQVLDPLVEEEKRLAQNLREGLSTLLDMHNPAELGSLCGALGLVEECEFGTHGEKKAGVMRRIAEEGARHGCVLSSYRMRINHKNAPEGAFLRQTSTLFC